MSARKRPVPDDSAAPPHSLEESVPTVEIELDVSRSGEEPVDVAAPPHGELAGDEPRVRAAADGENDHGDDDATGTRDDATDDAGAGSRRRRRSAARQAAGSAEASSDEDPSARRSDDVTSATPPPCADLPLEARVEAVLLAADRPLTDARVVGLLGLVGEEAKASTIAAAVEALNRAYEETGRTYRIESVAGGRRMLTLPAFGPLLARLRGERQQGRISPAALETLSIIAYRQPILRADLEAIRGVACGEVLRGLMERRLVRIVGRSEEPGRPMLYGTTREFLQVFGLSSVDDLPAVADGRGR